MAISTNNSGIIDFPKDCISDSKPESTIADYLSLLKPRVMSLVIFTAIAGLVVAPVRIHCFTAFASILFTSLGAGAAGAFNMWYEKDIDSIMARTQKRALVIGVVEESDALILSIFLSVISLVGMAVCVNILSSLLLLTSIIFYALIYTVWLKRITAQNIVIGGASGAFPPVIGWASATGSIDFDAIILFAIIFLWTPPHFWALALYKSSDYKKANIPMLPITSGVNATKNQIIYYTLLMSIAVMLPYFRGTNGIIYCVISTILSLYFVILVAQLKKEQGITYAPKIFGYSIFYLFAIFGTMMIEKIILII